MITINMLPFSYDHLSGIEIAKVQVHRQVDVFRFRIADIVDVNYVHSVLRRRVMNVVLVFVPRVYHFEKYRICVVVAIQLIKINYYS